MRPVHTAEIIDAINHDHDVFVQRNRSCPRFLQHATTTSQVVRRSAGKSNHAQTRGTHNQRVRERLFHGVVASA